MTRGDVRAGAERKRALAIGLGVVVGAGLAVAAVIALVKLLSPPPLAVGKRAARATAVAAAAAPNEVATPDAKARRPSSARTPGVQQTVLPALTSTYDWPEEPKAPADVDDKRFTEALVLLCGPHADRQVRSWYAPWLLRAAREFSADPFLLGALMFRMSGCQQKRSQRRTGVTGLDLALYQSGVKDRTYHYQSFVHGQWRQRSLSLERFPFERDFAQSPESNLYFAAAFLRAWQEQERGLRAAFVQKSEYRHYVSHYVWGDIVASHREEDYVLVDRRRLLEYYGALNPRPPVTWRGFNLGCPLDGCPRVVISTLGDSRAGGKREHAGNDFESTLGEPIRAVADGKVVFAGVDLPGRAAASKLPIWAQRDVDPGSMGAGGLYVCIDHGVSAKEEKLVSCYMHLEAATVAQDRIVERGEQIGRVGTSGIKQSRPHLHFELHASDGVHASLEVLRGIAIGNPTVHAPPPPDEAETALAESTGP